jgi:hypothetical protein
MPRSIRRRARAQSPPRKRRTKPASPVGHADETSACCGRLGELKSPRAQVPRGLVEPGPARRGSSRERRDRTRRRGESSEPTSGRPVGGQPHVEVVGERARRPARSPASKDSAIVPEYRWRGGGSFQNRRPARAISRAQERRRERLVQLGRTSERATDHERAGPGRRPAVVVQLASASASASRRHSRTRRSPRAWSACPAAAPGECPKPLHQRWRDLGAGARMRREQRRREATPPPPALRTDRAAVHAAAAEDGVTALAPHLALEGIADRAA